MNPALYYLPAALSRTLAVPSVSRVVAPTEVWRLTTPTTPNPPVAPPATSSAATR